MCKGKHGMQKDVKKHIRPTSKAGLGVEKALSLMQRRVAYYSPRLV
jgi:hypothetical protein